MRRSDRGAATVEMALVLPMLLFITFAVIDFGRMFNEQLVLTQAAREGARAAAFVGRTPEQREENAEDRVQLAAGNMVGPAVEAEVTACPASPNDDDNAEVIARHDFVFLTPLALLFTIFGDDLDESVTLEGMGVMPCL